MWTGRGNIERERNGERRLMAWRDWPTRPEWQRAVSTLRHLGRRTGNEHAITLTPAGECVGGTMCGERHVVSVGPDVLDRLDTSGEELAVCHSHPAQPFTPPNELSAPDLILLGRAGVRSLHMVSPYEPLGYSIAHKCQDIEPSVWRRVVSKARDVAFNVVNAENAAAYRESWKLERIDHQRVLVRMLDKLGLIEWQRRFDGATARFEEQHGGYLDELSEAACSIFLTVLSAEGTVWFDPGAPSVCHEGSAGPGVVHAGSEPATR